MRRPGRGDRATEGARVLVAGGGIAGVEAALAVRDLAAGRARVTLLSPEREFVFRPGAVASPFTDEPLERHALEPMLAGSDIDFAQEAMAEVLADESAITTRSGFRLGYEFLIVCIGAQVHPAYDDVATFWPDHPNLPVRELLESANRSYSGRLALVVPPEVGWSLPIYELAFMLSELVEELGLRRLGITIYTSEPAPLSMLGAAASAEVARLLGERSIAIENSRRVVQDVTGRLLIAPQGIPLDAGVVIALPRITGPRIPGIPADPQGFIVVDEFCRVEGLRDVYAAGDGTDTPMKQGGLASQQADAAAEHIASRLGADIDPHPFEPVLRGWLHADAKGRRATRIGYGRSEPNPPQREQKVSARYLSNWLGAARERVGRA
ncbi:FAD-dependent oxidoreductase [Thermoleophilia bacterium SCSIO 60948]|nr:FAD-dependent oxidoreductase [Thermoleophilia bacterium SCSIO 60948]